MPFTFVDTNDAYDDTTGLGLGIGLTLVLGQSVIVLAAENGTTGVGYSCADTNLNHWDKLGVEGGDATLWGVLFHCPSVTVAGPTTINCVPGTGVTHRTVAYWRYTGLGAAQTQSVIGTVASSATANAVKGASVTPTSQPCMLFSIAADGTLGLAYTAGTGYANRGQMAARNTGFGDTSLAQDLRLTSTAAIQAAMSQSGAGSASTIWSAVIAEAGGGGAASFPARRAFPPSILQH